jgi:hypothetical protein
MGMTWRGVVVTYYDGHAGALDDGAEEQHAGCDLPARRAPLDAAADNDDEGDEGAQFDDDGEGDEEANCAPHIAEGRVLFAVARAWEGDAGARDC